jgi:hypothetical protein
MDQMDGVTLEMDGYLCNQLEQEERAMYPLIIWNLHRKQLINRRLAHLQQV